VADVSRERRGQLLLVGAILLGTIFVGLALVVNSAIFAENLATREGDSVGSDSQSFRSAAVAGVADTMESTNRDGAGESFVTLRDGRYQPRVRGLADQFASSRSLDGTAVDLSAAGSRPGTQLVDDDASTITPRGDTPADWTMATGAHVRAFELTAEPTTSITTSDVTDQLTGGSGDAFVVRLAAAGGPTHEVAVYEDGDVGSTAVRVAVSEVGSSTVRECDAEGSAAPVSLAGRPTVDGSYCDPLASVAGTTGTYDVTVDNGDVATGTYRLVVDRTDGPTAAERSLDEQVDRANYGAACSGTTYADDPSTHPHSVPAIYAGTVDLRYRTDRVDSETTVRVASNQAGDGLVTPTVASLAVADGSGSDDASFTVDWTVEDPNGDLDEVTVTATNVPDGDSWTDTTSVSGASADDSVSVTDTDDAGDEYEITVTASDGTNDRSRTVAHVADGDDSGCPS
jgi:hypothetical protein